jgi:MHS family proline/betaine transporter-like MFS transporter
MLAYGWRIPFAISFFMIIISYFVRKNLPESFLFKTREQGHFSLKALKKDKVRIINTFIYTIGIAIGFYLLSVFTTTYLNISNKIDYQTSLYLSNSGIILLIIISPIMGKLSDIVGRKRLAIISNICLILFAVPIYFLMNLGTFYSLTIALIIFSSLIASILGPLPAILAEQFHTDTRATSIAISYNICVTIFGGTSPIISLFLIKFLHSNLAPGVYLACACLISLVATFYIRDLSNRPINN